MERYLTGLVALLLFGALAAFLGFKNLEHLRATATNPRNSGDFIWSMRVEVLAGSIVVINHARSVDIADDEIWTPISVQIRGYHRVR